MNQKVSDLISRAEMEQNDYRRGSKPNVFFGVEKRYFGMKSGVFISTPWFWSCPCSDYWSCSIGFCEGNWKSAEADSRL